jgi:primosomal protein N' (replication factor Y)
MTRLVSVAVPLPIADLLTYQIPPELTLPPIGARVLVPLGTRLVTGCAVAYESDNGHARQQSHKARELRPVADILDGDAFLPAEIVELALWISAYYMASPGEAIRSAMPPGAWVTSEPRIEMTDAGIALASNGRSPGRGRQAGLRTCVLEALSPKQPVTMSVLARRVREHGAVGAVSRPPLYAIVRALARDNLVVMTQTLRGKAEAFQTRASVALTVAGHEAAGGDAPQVLRLGGKQRLALEYLRHESAGLPGPVLSDRGVSAATIRRLAGLGLVVISRERIERDPFLVELPDTALEVSDSVSRVTDLTDEQTSALGRLEAMAAKSAFEVALLHGVTGSGKTEIYLRLARRVRAIGKSVLVLVPEIALTPAVARAFRTAFGEAVAVQHSGLSDGERYDQWHRIRRGDVNVVVGTRSAVFAPLEDLGLIVVDEEHDGAYKQEESPRYNGRDVAVMRGRRAGALVVLGSATPSIESYQNAVTGRYALIALERRVHDRPLAKVHIVNMREEYASTGPDTVVSQSLRDAIAARLDAGEQSLVLLNRRGLATAVFCRQCTHVMECPNCSVPLTVHGRESGRKRAICHYCNYSVAVSHACPKCAGPYLEHTGFGTERVEQEIQALFPAARVARLDRDTARRRGAISALLTRVARREIDVLVGTQMIAKGHDFPSVTLVGVISADVGLALADFRAAERTFQLLTQVAGRAGRGAQPGQAIVQTLFPDHYSIQYGCRQDYRAFFTEELRYRRAMKYPPVVALVSAVAKGATVGEAASVADRVAKRLRAVDPQKSRFRVLGPAPAPLGKLRGEHRMQIFLKGPSRAEMRAAFQSVLKSLPDVRRSVVIDIDPLAVL